MRTQSEHRTTGRAAEGQAEPTPSLGRSVERFPGASTNSIVTGSSLDELGMSVAAGDLNGDGAPDLIAGAPQFATGAHGYAAIFFGSGAAQSQTSLTLTPRGDPIIIPPTGGSFRFRLELTNLSSATRTIDILITLTGPGSQRTIAQFSQTLPAGESFIRSFTTRGSGSCAGRHLYRQRHRQCIGGDRGNR